MFRVSGHSPEKKHSWQFIHTRNMGRHKEFDRDDVLRKATNMFWLKGYEGTSVQDLVDCMGINRGSLYDTFGDKHTLFLAALDYYRDDRVSTLLKILLKSTEGVGAIRQFFNTLVEYQSGDRPSQGCLMVNATVECAIHDDEAAVKVSAHMAVLEDAFYRALLRAQRQNELAHPTQNLRAMARFFVNTANGLCVTAKTSPDRAVLQDIADVTLSVLTKK